MSKKTSKWVLRKCFIGIPKYVPVKVLRKIPRKSVMDWKILGEILVWISGEICERSFGKISVKSLIFFSQKSQDFF